MDDYFADLYEVGKTTVSRWIAKLINYGYLYVDTIMDGKQIVERRLYLSDQNATTIAQKSNTPIAQKSNTPIAQKSNTPIAQKSKGNNTSINNTSINTEILNITEDLTFVHSENFGEKGVETDMEVNQSSVVSDETTPVPLGVSQKPKSAKQAEVKAERVEKQFLGVVEVYNRVFAHCPAVSKVNLKAKAANQNRKKLISAAWAIAKDRVLTSWVDEQGLIERIFCHIRAGANNNKAAYKRHFLRLNTAQTLNRLGFFYPLPQKRKPTNYCRQSRAAFFMEFCYV